MHELVIITASVSESRRLGRERSHRDRDHHAAPGRSTRSAAVASANGYLAAAGLELTSAKIPQL